MRAEYDGIIAILNVHNYLANERDASSHQQTGNCSCHSFRKLFVAFFHGLPARLFFIRANNAKKSSKKMRKSRWRSLATSAEHVYEYLHEKYAQFISPNYTQKFNRTKWQLNPWKWKQKNMTFSYKKGRHRIFNNDRKSHILNPISYKNKESRRTFRVDLWERQRIAKYDTALFPSLQAQNSWDEMNTLKNVSLS